MPSNFESRIPTRTEPTTKAEINKPIVQREEKHEKVEVQPVVMKPVVKDVPVHVEEEKIKILERIRMLKIGECKND